MTDKVDPGRIEALADLPPEPMLWCPTCLGRYIVALGCADAVLREAAA